MSFFERMMRNAAPVLFWTAVLLFIGGFAMSVLQVLPEFSPYSGSGLSAQSFVMAIFSALSSAVWPFMGAGIIWTLQRKRDGGAE